MEKKDKINEVLAQYGPIEPVAIVGMACRFPGEIYTLDDFWNVLVNKKDALGQIPENRMGNLAELVDVTRNPGKIVSNQGGFLKDIEKFDANFFNISPKEAEKLDPQQRLLLEVAYEAIDDSTVSKEKLWGSNAGVFVAMWISDWEHRIKKFNHDFDVYSTTGSGRYAASGRISFTNNLQGTAITLDTACSSSLVAMHLAVQAIQSGTMEMALVGAANMILDASISIGYSRSGLLSTYGKCAFGEKNPGGYVRSEGAAMFLLKPLRKALEDDDYIHSIIRGTGSNNDGQSHDLMLAPSAITQGKMIEDVLSRFEIAPADIQYIEAHGTGTQAGDSAEFKSIPEALSPGRKEGDFFYVGSAKTNIGHTESVAGFAGAMKTILAIKNRLIPPDLHFDNPNPDFDWKSLPLKIPTEVVEWPHPEKPLLAGVNAFGITGTNAHLVLMEAPKWENNHIKNIERKYLVLPISAATDQAIKDFAQLYLNDLIAKSSFGEMVNYVKNIAFRKNNNLKRLVVLFWDKESLLEGLTSYIKGTENENCFNGAALPNMESKVTFVFPGQGSQWANMGKELFEKEPVFKQAILDCEIAYSKYVDWKLTDSIFGVDNIEKLKNIDIIQPAIVAVEIALAKLWQSWGILPSAVVGHSMGEAASAYISGAISIDEMANIICTRSKLMKRTSGKGTMAYIAISVDEALDEIKGKEQDISIGVSNSPKSAVISGNPDAINAVLQKIEAKGIFNRLINVDVASHSPQMDELKEELKKALESLKPKEAKTPFYSTVEGKQIGGETLDANYWVNNLRSMVQFGNTIQGLLKTQHLLYLEMSPHPVLTQAIKENFEHLGIDGFTSGTLERDKPAEFIMAKNLAIAWSNGVFVEWRNYFTHDFEYEQLPIYPYQKEVFWMEENLNNLSQSISVRKGGVLGHPLLMRFIDIASDSDVQFWETELNVLNFPYLSDHKVHDVIVFPAAGYLEMGRAAVEEVFGKGNHMFENANFFQALSLAEQESRKVQVSLKKKIGKTYVLEISSINESKNELEWQPHFVSNIIVNSTIVSHEIGKSNTPNGIEITKKAHYNFTNEIKLPYEEAFQTIKQAKINKNFIEAEISAGIKISSNLDRYGFHPAILDGCFQAFLLAQYENPEKATFVPSSIGSIVFKSIQQKIENCSIKIEIICKDENQYTTNGHILDENGTVIVDIQGFVFEKLEKDTSIVNQVEDWIYKIDWKEIPLPITTTKRGEINLVFCHLEQCALVEQLKPTILVLKGNNFSFQKEGTQFKATINPSNEDNLVKLFETLIENKLVVNNIIHLWALNSIENEDIESFYEFQSNTSFLIPKLVRSIGRFFEKEKPRLWTITKNAIDFQNDSTDINTFAAPIYGMGRTIDNENPEIKFTRVDISNETTDVDSLVSFLNSETVENELSIRKKAVYAARLSKENIATHQIEKRGIQINGKEKFFEASIEEPGIISNIKIKEKILLEPSNEEVQIEVMALGINFMNLMSALGIYPGKENGFGTLGIECAGIVTKIGKDITHLNVGDRVFGMAYHSMASHINVNGDLMQKIPNQMNFDEAATIPAVFLTSYYSLVTLGRLKKGERVLIHAATGGVGLSAIQIAQEIGAEIFATAGSHEKRNFLKSLGIKHVYDSRNIDFVNAIQNDTNKEGIDVVLNSLTGEAMLGSLSLLGNFGRFIEIGKKDVYENAKVGLEIFSKSLSYSMVDFEKMIFEKPEDVGALLKETLPFFENGKYKALDKKVFSIENCVEAFEFMSKSAHIGKIVINIENKNIDIESLPITRTSFKNEATYLLSGGYGGLGLTFVKWMFDNGAKHFILTGRSGPNEEAKSIISQLREEGATIEIEQADSSSKADWKRIINNISKDKPLKGILHLAGILDDSSVQNLEDERFKRVMKPKVDGAFYLQQLTKDIELDLFILFSSSSLLFGSPGQAAYGAANAYLDALSCKLKQQNRESLSINWGTVSEVGLAAQKGNRGNRLEEEGVFSLTPLECINAFRSIGNTDQPVVGIFNFNAQKWQQTYSTAAVNPYFEYLKSDDIVKSNEKISFRDQLNKIVDNQELVLEIENKIKEKAGSVLKLNPSKIEIKTPFKTMGIDSLMSIQLKNQLEKAFEMPISVTAFWTYPNIKEFTKFILCELAIGENQLIEEEITIKQPQKTETKVEEINIDDISDDDISKLLADELNNL